MKPLGLKIIGRFGNGLFQHAYAKALAEQQGRELHVQPWIGQKVFQLDEAPLDGSEEMLPEHYRQDQDSLIYTRADCRRWFAFRPDIEEVLQAINAAKMSVHLRRGDYKELGYVVVGCDSYAEAICKNGFNHLWPPVWVCEYMPLLVMGWPDEMIFVPDFYRLMKAEILFRANSSFSYWAAVLSHARVFSPVIDGLEGGKEHDDVPFVEGNWPRLAELPGITNLHLKES